MCGFEPRFRWASLFVCLFVLGCGDDAAGPDPARTPPDLSGTYELRSFWSQLLSGGDTLTAPSVSGSFTATQAPTSTDEAEGVFTLDVEVPAGKAGEVTEINDAGSYKVRVDGSWEQVGVLGQAIGTYALEGGALTIRVTSPALAVSTTVWQKR